MTYFRATLCGALLCLALFAESSSPSTLVVDTDNDSHDLAPGDGLCADPADQCSFRAAIEEANASGGADTVIITSSIGRIPLSLGTIVITKNSTVLRGDAPNTILDGIGNPLFSVLIQVAADSCEISGLTLQRSRGHGIVIVGSHNRLGRADSSGRLTAVGNGLDNPNGFAVLISGSKAKGNGLENAFIGVTDPGTSSWANRNGVGLSDSTSQNTIGGTTPLGRVVISGNSEHGVVLFSDAYHNTIQNAYIGCDLNGSAPIPNLKGGLLITAGARENVVGDTLAVVACLISGNDLYGVAIEGTGSDSNAIVGNLVGHDFSGRLPLGNNGYGIVVRGGANHTLIGGNDFLAGNAVGSSSLDGIRIEGPGTRYTYVRRNFVGLDVRGSRSRSNGLIRGSGIAIVGGASDNVIGGDTLYRNIISGNITSGVLIRGHGTQRNVVAGNFIGAAPNGLNIFGNSVGVMVDSGASYNLIGGDAETKRNLLSGNQSPDYPFCAGVLITGEGTSHNDILGNYIGLDITGTRAIRNSIGIILGDGAFANRIGGPGPERNVISGNGVEAFTFTIGRGIHFSGEGTSENIVCGNWIGTGGDGVSPMPNRGTGIGFTEGVNRTTIGAGEFGCENRILYNDGFGLAFTDSLTKFNTIGVNQIADNDSGAIKISGGAQQSLTPPIILQATLSSVTGQVAPSVLHVDLYLARPDQTGAGQPIEWISSAPPTDGKFAFENLTLSPGSRLTAIATDAAGNSSACAANVTVDVTTDVGEDPSQLPFIFSLKQNYPNPFNSRTEISFVVDRSEWVRLSIFNLLGQEVAVLLDQPLSAGEHRFGWAGKDRDGRDLASGVYWYRLESGDRALVRKMVLLK